MLEMKAGFFSKKEFSKFVPNCQSFDRLCQNLLVPMWAVGLGWHWRLLDWPALGSGGDNKDTCVQTTKTSRKNEDSLEFLQGGRYSHRFVLPTDLRTMSLLTVIYLQRGGGEKKKSNFVSFTLTVPAMPCGHGGGDGVAGVEVTPHSTELPLLHPSVLHRADANFGR